MVPRGVVDWLAGGCRLAQVAKVAGVKSLGDGDGEEEDEEDEEDEEEERKAAAKKGKKAGAGKRGALQVRSGWEGGGGAPRATSCGGRRTPARQGLRRCA